VTEQPAEAAASRDPTSMLTSKAFVVLLLLAAVVGVVVSLAAWGFLELVHQIQVGVFDELPGPEAPLIALGGGLGVLAVRVIPRDLPPEVSAVIAASGTIEATGLGCRRLPLVLVPGLLAAGSGRSARSAWDRGRAELERVRARRGPLGAETAIRSWSAAASPPHARTVFFSFATLTPVGYRNLTAPTDLRRTPALIEALLGQLYLVMGVSGGVANLVPRRRFDGGSSP
jgi:hypothetical protein